MRVIVDMDLCEGNAVCEHHAPEVFKVNEDDKSQVLIERPGEELRAKAATEYPTDVSTLKATRPLMNGACSPRSCGRRVRIHSLVACCTQNPADDTANSRAGDTGW